MRYQIISYESEMKPASPATATASGNGIIAIPAWPPVSRSKSDDFAARGVRRYRIKTLPPITALITAATATDPDIPRVRIVNCAAAKQAVADPRVFTK